MAGASDIAKLCACTSLRPAHRAPVHLCTCTCAVRIRYRHRLTVPSWWTGHRGLRASRFLVRGACHWFTRLAFVVRFVVLWLRLPFALLAVVAGHWSLVTGRRGSWFGVCVRVAFLTEYCVLAFVRPVFCVVRVPAVGSLPRSRFSSHSHPPTLAVVAGYLTLSWSCVAR